MLEFKPTKHLRAGYPLEAVVGVLPLCWDPADPRPALEQHDERQMGNGPWDNFNSHPGRKDKFTFDPETGALSYPEDPDMLPLAEATLPLTGEKIYVYESAWVAIVSPGGMGTGTVSIDRRD
jgi:hypothetical protein